MGCFEDNLNFCNPNSADKNLTLAIKNFEKEKNKCF